ncbi:hypothetical protein LCGC14_0992140 [marine sediment metagenome]|uniref:Holin n=1 Tax=marine sediment metagenome TaxID=412755 RepID=A0A0F9NA41_9ZZZZ
MKFLSYVRVARALVGIRKKIITALKKEEGTMGNKWFVKSKTIIGIFLSILPTILPAFGVSFGADDVQLVNGFVDALIQLAGVSLAVYGRFVATQPITVKP